MRVSERGNKGHLEQERDHVQNRMEKMDKDMVMKSGLGRTWGWQWIKEETKLKGEISINSGSYSVTDPWKQPTVLTHIFIKGLGSQK